MKKLLSLLILLCLEKALHAQYIYTIKADSVKITNSCDTAELIIENHTQDVCGFLFNKGKGRTEFRRGLVRLNDSVALIGCDTLKMNPWLQDGNRFGTIGKFGTVDNYPVDFYTNNVFRGRWNQSGNLTLGNNSDNGHKFQLYGSSYFDGTQDITGAWSSGSRFAHTRYYPDLTNAGSDFSEIYGMSIEPDIKFTSNNQLGYALQVNSKFNLNGNSQHGDQISAALLVRSNLGGIKVAQSASADGNTGQPLFLEQEQNTNKEIICNYRNGSVSTRSFIWNLDNRPIGVSTGAIVPALRSTISNVTAGGGISYTLDRMYYGTEAAMEMKYDDTPKGDTFPTRHTSVTFKSMSSGILYNSLYLHGDRVGMGTTSPSAQLHTTGTVRFAGLTNDNSQARVVVSDASGNLYFRDASSLTLNENMNSDLAVNGRVSAQQMLITQTGRWPDYVFSKQYQLPSLAEVESFINQNSHFPGVPSAAEVEKKGY